MDGLQTTTPWASLIRAVAVVSLGVLAVLVAIAMGSIRGEARNTEVDGQWPVVAPASVAGQTVSVPFSFRQLGLPPTETVTIELPLTLRRTLDEPAVLVDHPLHHVAVRWDGMLVASMGSLAEARSVVRQDHLLATVPPELAAAGDHKLTLTIRGDHGEGGLGGRLRVGEEPALQALADGHTAESLGLAAMLCMASVLGLVLASVRPSLEEFLWFGVFCAAAATNAFASDDGWWLVSNRLDLKLRVAVAGYALLPGSGLLMVQHWLGSRRQPWAAVLMNAGFLVALFSLVWPYSAVLPIVSRVNDVVAVAAMFFTLLTVGRALRNDVEGAPAIALSVVLLVAVAAAERSATLLGLAEPRVMLPGFLLFVGTAAAALVLRSADLADRYRQLVSSARDAIFVVLADGTVEEVNAAAEVLLAGDPIGAPLWQQVLPEDRELALEHVISGGTGPRRADLHLVGAGGRVVPVESVATDVPEGRVMLVMRDISARRQVEEGMLHAARMETVGIIAGGIAHDFNNTMTALMAHIGLLRLKVEDEADRQRLTRMEGVIRRAAHMTRRLLTLARGGRKERTALNIAQPVHSAVELTRSMLPRNITIKERIDPGLPAVLGSEDDLEQAVLNLLVNSRDALAPTGGTIRVRVRTHREAGLPAGVRVDVEDDGPGVPASVRTAIWEPFFTTKGSGRGTGLGLSVVARVIREHGGRIELIESRMRTEGRPGARFRIVLPGAEDAPSDTTGPITGRSRRVLVVDDEEAIREMIRSELATRGYQTTAADSAEQALAIVDAAVDSFDALVTDVVMPGMDGVTLAHQLCDRFPELCVVIVSGFIPEHADDLDPAWQSVAKPFQIEHLATALRRALVHAATQEDVTAPRSIPPRP